ncbi:MAG: hypothetical protein ACOC3V_05600 [bacterium]
MKAILEFNLPENDNEFRNAINGSTWQHIVWQIDSELRHMTKHQNKNKIEIDEIRDLIYEKMRENDLSFDTF